MVGFAFFGGGEGGKAIEAKESRAPRMKSVVYTMFYLELSLYFHYFVGVSSYIPLCNGWMG